MKGEKLSVQNIQEVKQVLKLLKNEFFKLLEISESDQNKHSFYVEFIPISLPHTTKLETINAFKMILEGACLLTKGSKTEKPKVSVLELVVKEGKINSYSYIVTPLGFEGNFSGSSTTYHSYFFIRAATSLYSGTGPEIEKQIQNLIEDKIPVEVQYNSVLIGSIMGVENLFYELGPIFSISFPHFEIPLRGTLDPDERFVE